MGLAQRKHGFLEFLMEKGQLSPAQVKHYAKLSRHWGSDLIEVLVGTNALDDRELAQYVSEYFGVGLKHYNSSFPVSGIVDAAKIEIYLSLKVIPWARRGNVVEVACVLPSMEAIEWATETYGPSHKLSIISLSDFNLYLKQQSRTALDHSAREKLYELNPNDSAKNTLTTRQIVLLALTPMAVALGLYFYYGHTLFIVCAFINAYYSFTLLFRSLLTVLGSRSIRETEVTSEDLANLDETTLPTYTVLVAMYKEATVLPILTQHLRELDYPRSKLEIKIVLEEDDHETLEVAKTLHLENFFEFLVIPASQPKTKPKALNFALPFVRGEFVTIYDAEDRPDPLQLKKAFMIFTRLKNVSCVQARLNYFNANENFITRMFTIEYSQWFDYFLLGLYRLNVPIPLGGTSNHFRTEILRNLGGWDPYNVTEDADLGLRMEKYGYRVALVDSTTYEEANTRVGNWIRQRSRWLKGHMQTFLIHMRRPVELFKEVGPVGFFGFIFFIGGPCFVALANPILMGLVAATMIVDESIFTKHFPEVLSQMAFFNVTAGNILFILMGAWAVAKRKQWKLIPWALLLPVYWILQSVAAYKAVWQLIFKPHFWEKTTHGLSAHMHAPTPKKEDT